MSGACVRIRTIKGTAHEKRLISVLLRVSLPSLLVVSLCRSALAFPSPNVPCPLPGKDSQTFLSVDELAPPIFHALQTRFGNELRNGIDMAARDSDWQETDLVEMGSPPLSFRRFIQAGHDGSGWYVWYERGGIGQSYQIAIFDLPAGAEKPRLVFHNWVERAEKLCPATLSHLRDSGDVPQDEQGW